MKEEKKVSKYASYYWLGKKLTAEHKRKIAVSRRAEYAARVLAGKKSVGYLLGKKKSAESVAAGVKTNRARIEARWREVQGAETGVARWHSLLT